jgi:nitroreductase
MEALECIKTRRSIRKFTEQPVTEDEVRQVVEAAAFAPSWKNTQIARYIVVTDKEKKDKLADNCMLGFAYNQKTTHGAPALVVLTMIKERSGYERDGSFSTPKEAGFEMFDAGVAAQTFCLSAWERGVGTVITGYFDEEKITRLLNLPENQKVGCVIGLGYPDEEPAAPKRKSVEDLLTYK